MKQNLIILTLFLLCLAAGLNATFLKRGGKDSASTNTNKKDIYFVPESPTVVQPVITQSQTSVTVPSQTFYASSSSAYEETPTYIQTTSVNTAAPVVAKVERVYRSDEQEVAQEYGLVNFDHDLEIVKKPIAEQPQNNQTEPEHQKTAGLLNKTHSQVSEAFEKIRDFGLSIDSREKLVEFLTKITHFNKALGFHKEQLLKSIHKNYDLLETINTQLLSAKNRMLTLDNHDFSTLASKVHDIDAIKEQIRNIQRIRTLFVEVSKRNLWEDATTVYTDVPTVLVKYFTLNNLVYRVNNFVTYHESDPCDVFFRHIAVIPIYNWVHPVYFSELTNYVRIENRVRTIYTNFGTVLSNVVVDDNVKLDSIESKLTKDLEDVQKSMDKLGNQLKGGAAATGADPAAKESEAQNNSEKDSETAEEDSKTEKIEQALEKDVKKSDSEKSSEKSEDNDESLTDTFNKLEKELKSDKEEQQKLEAENLKKSKATKSDSEKNDEEEDSKENEVKAEVSEEDNAENNNNNNTNGKDEANENNQDDSSENNQEEEDSQEKKKKESKESKAQIPAVKTEVAKSKSTTPEAKAKKTQVAKKKGFVEESSENSEESEDNKSSKKESTDEENSNEEPKDEDKEFEGLNQKLEMAKNKQEEKKKKEKSKKPSKAEVKATPEENDEEDDILNEKEKSLFKEEDAEEAVENSKVFAKKVNNKNAIFTKRFGKQKTEKSKGKSL